MSPEQARGLPVDKRADIWAFGCVLYEMMTGRVAFGGATVSDTIAAILERDLDWQALPESTPPSVSRLLRRCLTKDASRRLRDIADAKLDLEESVEPIRPAGRKSSARVGTAVVGALAIGALASALYFVARPPTRQPDTPEIRAEIPTPGADGSFEDFALSPDGRTLAFVAAAGGKPQIWLRPLDAERAQPLEGTEGALEIFWSPDSRSIGFFADVQLKKIDLAGGPPVVLAPARGPHGGTWNANGDILFAQVVGPLHRIPARGGDAVAVTRVDPPRITAHWDPFFLPDGRHFLFLGWGTPDQKGVYVGSLDSTDTHRLVGVNSTAVFSPPDLVLYARQGALVAQRLDLTTWRPVGVASQRQRRGSWPTGRAGRRDNSCGRTGPAVRLERSARRRRPAGRTSGRPLTAGRWPLPVRASTWTSGCSTM
jgi:hypothetical protein